MSRIEAGHIDLVEDRFDLRAMLDDVAEMFTATAAAKGIQLTFEPPHGLPRALVCDGKKVKQVLINLVNNAVKFTEQGSITITAAWHDNTNRVELVVADTGIGIAEEARDRLFQPFEQLEAGTKVGGTGLGLSICFAYARLMGGGVTVEGAPGVGSTFAFTFAATNAGPARIVSLTEPCAPCCRTREPKRSSSMT